MLRPRRCLISGFHPLGVLVTRVSIQDATCHEEKGLVTGVRDCRLDVRGRTISPRPPPPPPPLQQATWRDLKSRCLGNTSKNIALQDRYDVTSKVRRRPESKHIAHMALSCRQSKLKSFHCTARGLYSLGSSATLYLRTSLPIEILLLSCPSNESDA